MARSLDRQVYDAAPEQALDELDGEGGGAIREQGL
jgi:hypothetical protein